MEKRIILAFILSFAVLYGFRALFSPPSPVNKPVAVPSSTQSIPPAPTKVENTVENTPVEKKKTPLESTPDLEIQAERAEKFDFDTPLYTATISNVGGVLQSYKLKAYADAEGRPIELIDQTSAAKVGWPLQMVTADEGLNATLANANFAIRREGERVLMEFAGKGVHARKVLQFDPENYEFSLDTQLTREGNSVVRSIVWQGGFGDQSIAQDPAKKHVLYQVDTAFKKINISSLKDPQEFNTARAGVEDQYFLAMLLLPESLPVKVQKHEYPGADGKPVSTLYVSAPLPEGKSTRVYVGPKDRQWLSKADAQLASVVDYGWFEFIARPLLFCLIFIHNYVGNFGWSIILLTLGINFLLFPLRLKQQVSMQKMQKIQPQMRTLQDKYKKLKANDPRRAQLQTEMMGLYKQHGVNPMGGCLPLLLQMPVFFGLYSMLSVSIELRRAPWILWIKDLSQHDPYYIIPILMAVSMLIMQKMTPTTVDPAQAKMMLIMPVMFLAMFLWVQSGLTLYWLTSNVVGIGQQVFINKYWSPHAEAKLQVRAGPKELRNK